MAEINTIEDESERTRVVAKNDMITREKSAKQFDAKKGTKGPKNKAKACEKQANAIEKTARSCPIEVRYRCA